jgi:hypothetical protein
VSTNSLISFYSSEGKGFKLKSSGFKKETSLFRVDKYSWACAKDPINLYLSPQDMMNF